mmetsp:Transcript_63816/g.142365  ORF Transcript_63816/g.142365 Transcript_63816/m.142365 type:complete len:205 (-) Transcript_63816:961-1575(-)
MRVHMCIVVLYGGRVSMVVYSTSRENMIIVPHKTDVPESILSNKAATGVSPPWRGLVSTRKSESSCAISWKIVARAMLHAISLLQWRKATPMKMPSQKLCMKSPMRTPLNTRTRVSRLARCSALAVSAVPSPLGSCPLPWPSPLPPLETVICTPPCSVAHEVVLVGTVVRGELGVSFGRKAITIASITEENMNPVRTCAKREGG